MKNEFVPYDIALAMKELGFNDSCMAYYFINRSLNKYWNKIYKNSSEKKPFLFHCTAPLYQQLFRWFREKGLVGYLVPLFNEKEWKFGIGTGKVDNRITCNPITFNSYEEAQDACLRKLIEIYKKIN